MAARNSEIRHLRWDEVQGDRIVLGPDRVKSGRGFVYPLSTVAIGLLEDEVLQVEGCRHVFRAPRWIDRDLAEMQLQHRVGDWRLADAYARDAVVEARRAVLERWAAFLTSGGTTTAADR